MKARIAEVLDNGVRVGTLSYEAETYIFRYDEDYLLKGAPPISFTLPTTRRVHISKWLFPFFYGLLAEGTNKAVQNRQLHLTDDDDFTRLLLTAHTQTVGAITVREIPFHE